MSDNLTNICLAFQHLCVVDWKVSSLLWFSSEMETESQRLSPETWFISTAINISAKWLQNIFIEFSAKTSWSGD